jgi:hypothetical protein
MLIPMLRLLLFLFRKDVSEMAVIYATLIVKGKKNFAEVPEKIKEQVRQVLIDLDCGDLATE